MLRAQEQKYSDVTQDLSDCKYQLAEQRREINLLKDRMRSLRLMPSACGVGGAGLSSVGGAGGSSGGSGDHRGAAAAGASGVSSGGQARTVTNQIQDDEVVRWSGSLTRARVTRWGGMISTPDAVLQVKKKERSGI